MTARCVECGYSLVGLAPNGVRPECGLAIALSLGPVGPLSPRARLGWDLIRVTFGAGCVRRLAAVVLAFGSDLYGAPHDLAEMMLVASGALLVIAMAWELVWHIRARRQRRPRFLPAIWIGGFVWMGLSALAWNLFQPPVFDI